MGKECGAAPAFAGMLHVHQPEDAAGLAGQIGGDEQVTPQTAIIWSVRLPLLEQCNQFGLRKPSDFSLCRWSSAELVNLQVHIEPCVFKGALESNLLPGSRFVLARHRHCLKAIDFNIETAQVLSLPDDLTQQR